jgi:hypothetical protein
MNNDDYKQAHSGDILFYYFMKIERTLKLVFKQLIQKKVCRKRKKFSDRRSIK